MTTTVTIVETPVEVTVEEQAITATITEQTTEVTVNNGISDHGALSGLGDDDHTQYLLKAGGTMTGALVLDADPATALQAATKQYVDAQAGGASDVGDLTTVGLTAANMLRVAAAGGLEERTPAQVLADIGAAASGHDHDADYVDVAGDTMTGNLDIGDTTGSTLGVVLKGATRFLHNFHHPTGDTAIPAGFNVFIGESAGNFAMGATATSTLHGSYNIGIGHTVLDALTTGWGNVGIGEQALSAATTPSGNIAIGWIAGKNMTLGGNNVAIGTQALPALTIGDGNFALGANTLQSLGTGSDNVAIGRQALQNLGGASQYNVAIGYEAGQNLSSGDNANVLIGRAAGKNAGGNSYSVFLGNWAGISETNSYRLYIDSRTTAGSRPLVYGEFDTGIIRLHTSDAVTAAVTDTLGLRHLSSGTPAAGFGAGLLYQLESSTTEDRNAARIAALWNDATDATRKADLVLSAYDTAEREGLRIRADGSQALLITNLPTSDPGVSGALWNNSGVVNVSP